jgi:hypothetical protein
VVTFWVNVELGASHRLPTCASKQVPGYLYENTDIFVMPAQAGIQPVIRLMGSRLRGNDRTKPFQDAGSTGILFFRANAVMLETKPVTNQRSSNLGRVATAVFEPATKTPVL